MKSLKRNRHAPSLFFLGLAIAALAFVVGTTHAQPDADDPFATGPKRQLEDLIHFRVEVTPKQARRGETVRLRITGILAKGYHTYPITQRTRNYPEYGLTTIEFADTPGIRPLWKPLEESR